MIDFQSVSIEELKEEFLKQVTAWYELSEPDPRTFVVCKDDYISKIATDLLIRGDVLDDSEVSTKGRIPMCKRKTLLVSNDERNSSRILLMTPNWHLTLQLNLYGETLLTAGMKFSVWISIDEPAIVAHWNEVISRNVAAHS